MPKTKSHGTKRVCEKCGTRFYDMDRKPPKCPKCGHRVSARTRGRDSRRTTAPPVKPPDDIEVTEVDDDSLAHGEVEADDMELNELDDDVTDEDDDAADESSEEKRLERDYYEEDGETQSH